MAIAVVTFALGVLLLAVVALDLTTSLLDRAVARRLRKSAPPAALPAAPTEPEPAAEPVPVEHDGASEEYADLLAKVREQLAADEDVAPPPYGDPLDPMEWHPVSLDPATPALSGLTEPAEPEGLSFTHSWRDAASLRAKVRGQ